MAVVVCIAVTTMLRWTQTRILLLYQLWHAKQSFRWGPTGPQGRIAGRSDWQELWLRRPHSCYVSKPQPHVSMHRYIICIYASIYTYIYIIYIYICIYTYIYIYIIYIIVTWKDNLNHLWPRLSQRVSGHFMPGISCGDWNPGGAPGPRPKNAKNWWMLCWAKSSWGNIHIYMYIYIYTCTYVIPNCYHYAICTYIYIL